MKKDYEFVVKVKFDKKTSNKVALHHIKEEFDKTTYDLSTFGWDKSCPEKMHIANIRENTPKQKESNFRVINGGVTLLRRIV